VRAATETAIMDTRKPIDPKKKERYAELIGLGLSHPEASGATGISERSGERLMAERGYRKIAEEAKRGRGMQGEVAQVVRDLLVAEKPDGSPDFALRQKGVEAYSKNPALLEGEDEAELLPDGVMEVYPVPPSLRDPAAGRGNSLWERPCAIPMGAALSSVRHATRAETSALDTSASKTSSQSNSQGDMEVATAHRSRPIWLGLST
jgi:hypothetical protein